MATNSGPQYFSLAELTPLLGTRHKVKLGNDGDNGFPPDAPAVVMEPVQIDDAKVSEGKYALVVEITYQTARGGLCGHDHQFDRHQFHKHFRRF